MIILKIHRIISSVFFILLFYSCKGQLKANDSCTEKFKTARALAYADSTSQSTLDSALNLINECMECDSIKKSVVDFKITLLVSMKKYSEGIKFIDSLKEEDFTFGYKKKFMSKGLQALEFNSVNDTAKRNFVYREMADNIEGYIEKKNLTDKEFKEIYTDLFAIKEHYLDAAHINNEVEILKNKYPGKQSFFDFFKK